MKTVLNTHTINREITLPMFQEFNQNESLEILLFEFHSYFDGLLGINILTQINANIDLEKRILCTKNSEINLQYKQNLSSDTHNISASSKVIINLPVDLENGDIYIDSTNLNNSLHITDAIYHAKDWHSLVEITNTSQEDKIFFVDHSFKAHAYNSEDFV